MSPEEWVDKHQTSANMYQKRGLRENVFKLDAPESALYTFARMAVENRLMDMGILGKFLVYDFRRNRGERSITVTLVGASERDIQLDKERRFKQVLEQ